MTNDGAQGHTGCAARALAEADFTKIAERFSGAGFSVKIHGQGLLQIFSSVHFPQRSAVLVSVGMHGDETGPIEMLAQLLEQLAQTPQALACDLMVVVGNIAAITQGKRFIDADLNRMFQANRGDLQTAQESARADVILRSTADFFAGENQERWHLDLHTAIRPSVYPTFAIVPELIADKKKTALLDWLDEAGIGAIIMNPKSAGTYSYCTAEKFGAAGATVELGRIGVLGRNDASVLAESKAALNRLLRGEQAVRGMAVKSRPHIFHLAQEIIKLSADFKMAFGSATQNFTRMEAGAVIATDGDVVYRVRHAEEFVVFPNPEVRVGQRAGLMVVRKEWGCS